MANRAVAASLDRLPMDAHRHMEQHRQQMEEVPASIEPCSFEESIPPILSDLVVEIQSEAARLGQGLHDD